MEPHRRHAAATDSCCCSGIHAGRRRRASSGANFAQFGTSPARTRCAMSIAFEMCAAHLQRAAHDLSQSSTGRTVRPQSVPNRASARNRDNFADSDILRLELVARRSTPIRSRILAVVIDVDRVPHAVLHRIPHLPRRRHCFHAGRDQLSECRCWYKVLMFSMAALTCDATRCDAGEVV